MKTPKEQIVDYFQQYNLEVAFQDVGDGFFAEVRNMPYPHDGKDVGKFNFDTVSVYYGGEQGCYRFAVSIILGQVTDISEVLRYSNDYNCSTYGWKATLERDDLVSPFFAFDYEFEFVQPDKISDVIKNAFEELCIMENEEYFYPLMRLQRGK